MIKTERGTMRKAKILIVKLYGLENRIPKRNFVPFVCYHYRAICFCFFFHFLRAQLSQFSVQTSLKRHTLSLTHLCRQR